MASAALRAAVFVAPIVGAAVTSALVGRWANRSSATGSLPLRWTVVILSSVAVLLAVDRLARRFLALVVLLRLELPFPGPAPSRYGVARAAANLRELEERVRIARTTLFEDSPGSQAEMILSLVAAAEAHERTTRGHAERVRLFTDLIGEQLKIHPEDRDLLRWAALLHDVGKIEVPGSVLNKPGPLDPRELEIVRRHPEDGARLARPLEAWLGDWARAIVQHHERWDGRGYPHGLTGADVSLGARILAVADVYETMTAARPYHRPKTADEARQELVRCSGTQFDPAIVGAFLQVPVRRLQLTTGPTAWIARAPILRGLERAATAVGRFASAAALAGGALAVSIAGVTIHR